MTLWQRFLKALPQPGQGLHPMIASPLIIFTIVIAMYLAVHYGYVDMSEPVDFTVDIETQPIITDNSYSIVVRPRITNNQQTAETLQAPTPCDVFRWILLTNDREFVQSKPAQSCVQVIATTELAPKNYIEETVVLELDRRRVNLGEDYQLLVRFWNFERLVPLTLEAPTEPTP